mgnify:CR=1 FL=1
MDMIQTDTMMPLHFLDIIFISGVTRIVIQMAKALCQDFLDLLNQACPAHNINNKPSASFNALSNPALPNKLTSGHPFASIPNVMGMLFGQAFEKSWYKIEQSAVSKFDLNFQTPMLGTTA